MAVLQPFCTNSIAPGGNLHPSPSKPRSRDKPRAVGADLSISSDSVPHTSRGSSASCSNPSKCWRFHPFQRQSSSLGRAACVHDPEVFDTNAKIGHHILATPSRTWPSKDVITGSINPDSPAITQVLFFSESMDSPVIISAKKDGIPKVSYSKVSPGI